MYILIYIYVRVIYVRERLMGSTLFYKEAVVQNEGNEVEKSHVYDGGLSSSIL